VIISWETHHETNLVGILLRCKHREKSEGNINGTCRGGGRDDVTVAHNLGVSDLNSHLGEFPVPPSLEKVICGRPASAEHATLSQNQRCDADDSMDCEGMSASLVLCQDRFDPICGTSAILFLA
jgi:hypothetical protein